MVKNDFIRRRSPGTTDRFTRFSFCAFLILAASFENEFTGMTLVAAGFALDLPTNSMRVTLSKGNKDRPQPSAARQTARRAERSGQMEEDERG
jgi:hypothetical protein